MDDELLKLFPEIQTARACSVQDNHELATEIYSEILTKASSSYEKDSQTLCLLYLEYAESLIKNCEEYFIKEISMISAYKAVTLSEKADKENDLVIAWDVLEIAKSVFIASKQSFYLSRSYFLLAEIQLLNNDFLGAINDYTNAMEELVKIKLQKSVIYCECLYKIATCNEFAKYYDESVNCLKKMIDVYKSLDKEMEEEKKANLISDIEDKIREVKAKKIKEEGLKKDIEEESDVKQDSDAPVININFLKKGKK